MAVKTDPQTSLYETVIDDPALEEKLEQRETLKGKARVAGKWFREKDEAVKADLGELDLADAPVRIGRFVVARREVAGRSVSFETNPSARISIKTIVEDSV